MSEEIEPPVRDRAYDEMMSLFNELTLRERIVKTYRGLSSPKDSGDYKFAKLQIQLLAGPLLAILLPVIAVAVLLSMEKTVETSTHTVAVEIVEPTETPEIEEEPPPPEEQIEFEKIDTEFDAPTENYAPTAATTYNSNEPMSPKPAAINSVAIVKSPIVMRGIVGSRSPGQRGQALKQYGGSAGGEATVMRALRWLKSKQQSDGSWPGQPTAMTGLALLAFLAHGETPNPDCEEFGPTVEKGIRYLVENQAETGLFKSKDGNNYAHPIATYALCEAYTLTKVPMLKTAAERALKHIVRGQHPNGGWDYNMKQTERDDTSYMGWCAQAIKAGHMAQDLEVEGLEDAFKNAVKGFKKNSAKNGGFGYTDGGPTGLSGVGTLCMQLLGASKEEEVGKALAYLEPCQFSFENWKAQPYNGASPIYYWYYITQAKFHAGGANWTKWNTMFQPELIKRQVIIKDAIADMKGDMRDIGYWDSPSKGEHSVAGGPAGTAICFEEGKQIEAPTTDGPRVQTTCLCALQLMVYYRYLPTFKTPAAVEDAEVTEAPSDDIDIKITR